MLNKLTQESVDESLVNALENDVDVRAMSAEDTAHDMCSYDAQCEHIETDEEFAELVSMIENWKARNPPTA